MSEMGSKLLLVLLVSAFLAVSLSSFVADASASHHKSTSASAANPIKPADDQLLEEIERAAFLFFWEQASSITGQVKDRALADGQLDPRPVASIAATGYGLSALTIAYERGYHSREAIRDRIFTTLDFAANKLENVHGFFYHFIHYHTGERQWECELSSIDTAIFICGVLNVRQYFSEDPEIVELATKIYERVDYEWMLNNQTTLSMGWKPESGFLEDSWNRYCELMMLVLQAIGSPTHPIPADLWNAFSRESMTYAGLTYIQTAAPLFIHQFSHAWYDFRGLHDNYTDYFENSVTATKAHKLFCLNISDEFPDYRDNFWGITSSDSIVGYQAWGGPPRQGQIDGSVVPCAAAGSIPFLPEETIAVLLNIRNNHPEAWKRYGYIDAFNPTLNWYNPDVIGIDVGITMLMAENYRTGFIWNTYMKDPQVLASMKAVSFVPKTKSVRRGGIKLI